MGRGRPGGNPDFGTKHRFDPLYDEPMSEKQLQIRLPQSQMDCLMKMAKDERLALVRGAIRAALATASPNAQALSDEVGSDELVQEAIRDAITLKQAAISREKKKGKRQDEKAIAKWASEIERLEKVLNN